jgi:hypothetical protein
MTYDKIWGMMLHKHKVSDITDIATTYLKLDQSTPQTLTTSPIFNNLTAGRIPFASATKTLTDDGALFWDNTNKRLGIGETSPSAKLHVQGSASAITAILRANATTPSDILQAQNSSTTVLASIASTGVILANYGLETAPGFSFQGDADTGFYRSTTNTLSTSIGGTRYVTLNSNSNNLLVQKDWPTYAYIGNSYVSLTGEGVTDTGMTGMYDRSETTNAAYRGTVTVSITGAGTFTDTQAEKNKLFDCTSGNFFTITGADATTTQVVIDVDMGFQLPNYNSANWIPFLQYRLNSSDGGTSSFFRNVDFKVSSNGVNYYAPATGWSTADFGADSQVPSYWFGVRGSPSGITGARWRYARITLTDLYQNNSYASKDKIWISQLGLRHVGAPWTTQYVSATGGTMYGLLNVQGQILVDDKIMFTQTDGNEYIDSLADGYMDYRATTGHRFGDGTNQAIIKADGEINLEGTARVYKVIAIRPSGFAAPGTKPAVSVEHGIGMSWEFSDGTDDTIEAEIQLPQDMDRTVAPEFNIGWDSDTADPGDNTKQCYWQLEYLYLSLNEDVTAAAQETLYQVTSASTTTNGLVVTTITGLDLPSATDRFMMIRIKRMGAEGTDTLGDVAYLNGCGFKYTSDKLGVGLT